MKRVINAASQRAEEFGRLHDSADYHDHVQTFDKIYNILDKYGSENEGVHEVFDKASPEDQDTLMKLVKSMHKSEPTITEEEIRAKYRKLQRGYERDTLDPYQDSYFQGMCDVADAFGIDLG